LSQKPLVADLVKEFGGRLKGFIRNRVSSAEDSEDILQDVFYQLAAADQLMKPIDQISAWLYTVARNRITDLYRKKKPELLEEYESDEDEEDGVLSEIGELLASSDDSPETAYLRSLVWVELEKALEELPPEQSSVFVMNELQDMSFKEIAGLTGEPENTLISRKRYAVLHLRERLNDLYDELINF
jgi:RNA polymerase sigma factor (sigma-70 family)